MMASKAHEQHIKCRKGQGEEMSFFISYILQVIFEFPKIYHTKENSVYFLLYLLFYILFYRFFLSVISFVIIIPEGHYPSINIHVYVRFFVQGHPFFLRQPLRTKEYNPKQRRFLKTCFFLSDKLLTMAEQIELDSVNM